MSIDNNLTKNLNSNYFTKENHQRDSWVDSFTDFFKRILGFECESRLKLRHGIDEVSIAMRTTEPSWIGSRQWVQVNLGSQPIFLNINSITSRTWLKREHINSSNFVNFLNAFSEPLVTYVESASEVNEGPKKSFEDLERLAYKPEDGKLVNAAQMQAAVDYVDSHREDLQIRLSQAVNSYIVLRKEETGLSHNLEYYGPNEVFLRYYSDFVKGSSKFLSKMVDLYGRELVGKSKFLVHDRPDITGDENRQLERKAEEYRRERAKRPGPKKENKRPYLPERIFSISQAKIEANLGQATQGVLKTRKFVTYKKEHLIPGRHPAWVHKAAIYALLQQGDFSNFASKNSSKDLDKKQATLSIVRNMAALHRSRICHNDAKDGNFLWSNADGQLKTNIIDMAFAKEFNESSAFEGNYEYYSNKGTIYAIPPEMFQEGSLPLSLTTLFKLNQAKDAFGVGITIYREIYGCPLPWMNQIPDGINYDHDDLIRMMNNTELLKSHLNDKNVPQDIQNVILGLLHPDPVQRMTLEQAEKLLSSS